jgi:hypothetical protein
MISRTADGGGADSVEAEDEAFTALDGPFKLKTVAGEHGRKSGMMQRRRGARL